MKTQNLTPNPAVCRDIADMIPEIVKSMIAEAKQTHQLLTTTIKNDKANYKIEINAYPQGFAQVEGMALDENNELATLIITS